MPQVHQLLKEIQEEIRVHLFLAIASELTRISIDTKNLAIKDFKKNMKGKYDRNDFNPIKYYINEAKKNYNENTEIKLTIESLQYILEKKLNYPELDITDNEILNESEDTVAEDIYMEDLNFSKNDFFLISACEIKKALIYLYESSNPIKKLEYPDYVINHFFLFLEKLTIIHKAPINIYDQTIKYFLIENYSLLKEKFEEIYETISPYVDIKDRYLKK